MKINVHSHVHPLKAIVEPAMLDLVIERFSRENLPPKILKLLAKGLRRSRFSDREKVADFLLKELRVEDTVKDLLEDLNNNLDDDDLGVAVEGDLSRLSKRGLFKVLRLIFGAAKTFSFEDDAYEQDTGDFFRFLMRGLAPDISTLAAEMMAELDEDDVMVALMMDICSDGQEDDKLFKAQIKETTALVLKYPGRLLPFVKFNPKRKSALELAVGALESGGCVGLKLYPSLRYRVTIEDGAKYSVRFRELFEYCDANEVPVLPHCNHGGFVASDEDFKYCDPNDWIPILQQYDKLKVCFGHFGDEANMVAGARVVPGSYTDRIVKLMKRDEFAGRVYADVSFHVAQIEKEGEAEGNYFTILKQLLADPVTRGQVLYGTDSFLVQKRMTERSYWEYYKSNLTIPELNRISKANPARYLGLPINRGYSMGSNIKRYIDNIDRLKRKISGHAPQWLRSSIEDDSNYSALSSQLLLFLSGWNRDNPIHLRLYELFIKKDFISGLSFEDSGNVRIKNLRFSRGNAGAVRLNCNIVAKHIRKELTDPGHYPHLELNKSLSKYLIGMRDYLAEGNGTLQDLAIETQSHFGIS